MNAIYTIKHSGLMFKADMIRAYLEGLKNQTRRTKGLSLVNEKPWREPTVPTRQGSRRRPRGTPTIWERCALWV